jgi:aminoglycoside 3-N-acetyltransferase
MGSRSLINTVLPESWKPPLRKARRGLRWRLAQMRGQVLTKQDLVHGLKRIGIRSGDSLLVHSSLSRLGDVEGGPDAVIDALLDVLGPNGTLLMPVYPVVGDRMAYIDSNPLFDPRRSPSSMGKLTNVFWQRPGVLRSLHPTHSVAAYGANAASLVSDHEKSPSPVGPSSPFYKLVDLDGRVLHLGSPFWAATSFHVVEERVSHFPVKVYLDKHVPMRYLDYEGVEHIVPIQIHDPVTDAARYENLHVLAPLLYQACTNCGVAQTSKIGPATVHLIECHPLVDLMARLVAEGITIHVYQDGIDVNCVRGWERFGGKK